MRHLSALGVQGGEEKAEGLGGDEAEREFGKWYRLRHNPGRGTSSRGGYGK